MEPYYDEGGATLYLGDCVEVMAELPPASVDSVVADPPYGLEFMGKDWDAFRSDDPGTQRNRGERAGVSGGVGPAESNHPARRNATTAYGGGARPKTSRCTGCGKRDQFRNEHDCAPAARWVAESLDPYAAPPTMLAFENWSRGWALEALRLLKPGGHLVAFGGTRTSHRMVAGLEDAGFEIRDGLLWLYGSGFPKSLNLAGGLGTALKPAHEPIVLARKPLAGTVEANVAAHGTGALNIEATRVGAEPITTHSRGISEAFPKRPGETTVSEGAVSQRDVAANPHDGRWPANVLLDPEAAAMLDEQAGDAPSGIAVTRNGGGRRIFDKPNDGVPVPDSGYADSGGPSRFYYTAKASRAEREFGLDDLPATRRADAETRDDGAPGSNNPRLRVNDRRNDHPTVKPIELMRWLVRLVTPAGGVVLDPFVGSGTTGIAALAEQCAFVGIDQERHYLEIAWRRIARRHFLADHPAPAEGGAEGDGQLAMQFGIE